MARSDPRQKRPLHVELPLPSLQLGCPKLAEDLPHVKGHRSGVHRLLDRALKSIICFHDHVIPLEIKLGPQLYTNQKPVLPGQGNLPIDKDLYCLDPLVGPCRFRASQINREPSLV